MAVDGRGGEGERAGAAAAVRVVDGGGGFGVGGVIGVAAEVCGEGGEDAQAVVLRGRTDGPAGDFDDRRGWNVERVEHLSTPIDAIVDVDSTEVREWHAALRVGFREGRETVGERDDF